MTMTVTGASGMIGRALVAHLGPNAHAVSALSPDDLPQDCAVVIHAGRDPRLGSKEWARENDVEWRWAEAARRRGARFVQLSSRKVYAPRTGQAADGPLARWREDAPLGPSDRYGAGKLEMERALADLLGADLLILRLSNIFGDEYFENRRSFFRQMSHSLVEDGVIRFDMSADTRRDFAPLAWTARAVAALARGVPRGAGPEIVNVGSGIGLPCGRLADAVIEGFGRGRLDAPHARNQDAFALDVGAMRGHGVEPPSETAILDACRAIGARLPGADPTWSSCVARAVL